jgi:comEA protein
MKRKLNLSLMLVLFVAVAIFAPQNGMAAEEKAVQPAMKAGAEKAATSAAKSTLSGPVNINTANAEELAKLPDIGPKTADEIVKYRKEHGDFKTTRDIINVKGIGEKKFQAIQDKITVGQ